MQYMREQAKLPSRLITTALEATNNFARTDANVIGYFPEENDMFEEYIGAANELRGEWISDTYSWIRSATMISKLTTF